MLYGGGGEGMLPLSFILQSHHTGEGEGVEGDEGAGTSAGCLAYLTVATASLSDVLLTSIDTR